MNLKQANQKNNMPSVEVYKLSLEFLELTSDSSLREAAYPPDEWKKNGGLLTILRYPAQFHDNPPDIEIRSTISGRRKVTKLVSQDSKSRERNIEAYRNIIRQHPYYLYISQDENFIKAKTEFEKLSSQKKSSKLVSEFADFRFMRIVARHIPFTLFMEESIFKPNHPDSRLLTQANGYIKKLLVSFDSGIGLNDYPKQLQLQSLLKNLQNEIQSAPRKDRFTETQVKRKCLESIALELNLNFDICSEIIITAFADILEWTADSKTIRGIIKKIRNTSAKSS